MILYILKVTACLAIFYAFYKLILENESMHNFKRFYLLVAIISALLFPTLLFTEYLYIEPTPMVEPMPLDFQSETLNAAPTPENTNYLPYILWTIYSVGVLVFGFKFCQNLYTIGNRIRINPKFKKQHITNVLIQEKLAPHTFFNFIFLNKHKFDAHEIPTAVLLHEKTHADQKHSVDVFFIELLQVFLWFNPVIYLFKKSIKLNHEFLADQAVMKKGVEITSYQKILLAFSSSALNSETALTNAINYSSIKKRFTVMKKNTSKKAIWLRSLLVLPLFALLLYGFSETEILTIEKFANDKTLNTIENDLEKIDALELNFSQDETFTISENIEIYINEFGKLFLQDKEVKLEHLRESLLKYNSDLSVAQRKKQVAFEIKVDDKIKSSLFHKVKEILNDYGYATLNIKGPKIEQDGATKEQISEYNVLAKKYNTMDPNNMRVKKFEVNRMTYLFNLMLDKQKKNAETFPELPPMPEPPMPPNLPNKKNAQQKALQEQEKALIKQEQLLIQQEKDLQVQENKLIKQEAKLNKIPSPPVPPTPKSALYHVIEMAKKNATFYYEDEKISADKAIELLKKNTKLNIESRGFNSTKPVVRISKNAIVIEY